jgi:CubicO group peptidase (beta-lactamase class C family)
MILHPRIIIAGILVGTCAACIQAATDELPKLPGIAAAIQKGIDSDDISGAVTEVVTKDKILDLEAVGLADIASKRPMQPNTVFWIKSMTKPITGIALMMLQDDGKLNVEDPVAKYIPEFANLKTPSGKPANLTIAQLMTHTSGLGEGLGEAGSATDRAHTLADLVRQALASPMQFEPGTKWKYTQSGINTVGRIIEVVSGVSYDQFLSQRLFEPLGMHDTRFYPGEKLQQRLVTLYSKNRETGELEPVARRTDPASRDRPPLATSGIYSTAPDIARVCQMLLNGGELDGKRYLKPETIKLFSTPRTGDLKAGFVPGSAWGLACGVVTEPQGVTEALSPGTYGHGGAFGTQMWIDEKKGVAYILMIQREKFGTPGYRNGDDTAIRHDFQQEASAAVAVKKL